MKIFRTFPRAPRPPPYPSQTTIGPWKRCLIVPYNLVHTDLVLFAAVQPTSRLLVGEDAKSEGGVTVMVDAFRPPGDVHLRMTLQYRHTDRLCRQDSTCRPQLSSVQCVYIAPIRNNLAHHRWNATDIHSFIH